MDFQVNERVVYPAFGVGRVIGVVSKTFAEPEGRLYYEVLGERSTVWVAVEDSDQCGLRRLTRVDELEPLREVLRGRPIALHADTRQRQLDLRNRLKIGSLLSMCEIMRDLTGRGWRKTLNDSELAALRRSTAAVCEEWAAVSGVSTSQASAEISALLGQARLAFNS